MSSYIFMQQAYECLLDQKAAHFIDYETTGFPQHMDASAVEEMLPLAKSQLINNGDFQHTDSSMIIQQLTPPQSPPHPETHQPQVPQQSVKQEPKLLQEAGGAAVFGFNNWLPVNEITRETQLVDDIVNMRAQELQLPIDWQQFNDDCESQASSSLDSSSSSCSGNFSSPNSSLADADEDWAPACSSGVSSGSSSPSYASNGEEQQQAKSAGATVKAKKRTRTYGRGVEDRKIRKKEQNKNAATRYRQKKKQELEEVLDEEHKLMQANDELRRQYVERRNESRYLRQLIREFYKERK